MCFICELMDPTGDAREEAREEMETQREYAEIAMRAETEEKLRTMLEPVVANITGFECSCSGSAGGPAGNGPAGGAHCEGVMTHLLAALVPEVSALVAAYGQLMADGIDLALAVLRESDDKGTDEGADDE